MKCYILLYVAYSYVVIRVLWKISEKNFDDANTNEWDLDEDCSFNLLI